MPNKYICITKAAWLEVQHMVSEFAIVSIRCSNPEGIDDCWEDRIIIDEEFDKEDIMIETSEDVVEFIKDHFEKMENIYKNHQRTVKKLFGRE